MDTFTIIHFLKVKFQLKKGSMDNLVLVCLQLTFYQHATEYVHDSPPLTPNRIKK